MFKRYLLLLLLVFAVSCTNKDGKNYTSLDDAYSDKIGVLMGSMQDKFITDKYPKAKIARIELVTDLISALKSDKCDVVIITSIQANEVLKTDPELKILQHDVCSNPMGVGFGKGNQALKEAFNLFLSEIQKNGLYDEIIERWTTGDENAKMPEIPLPTKGTPLRIGTTATSSPFSFEKNWALSGLDIELITRFAAHINRPVKFLKMNFAGLIPALISDKLDIIVNCIMITPERAKEVDFSDSYFDSKSVAIALSENIGTSPCYRDINDLSKKRISVVMGTTQDASVTKNFPQATILRGVSTADLLLALKSDKSDVIVLERGTANLVLKDNDDICILDEVLYESDVCIGFKLGDTTLCNQYNKMIEGLRQDGTYDQIYKNWVDNNNAVMPKFDMPKNGTPLRVGISSCGAPFDFYENGKCVGFDLELALRFGKFIGRPVKFVSVNFGGLIAAISSGKIDMIASGMTKTEERAKKVTFAMPHYFSKTSSIILKKNLAVVSTPTDKGYTSKEDLSTKRIAVLMGTTHDTFITENFPNADIIRSDSYSDVVMELIRRKCDAAVFNSTIYPSMKKSHPQIEILDSALFTQEAVIGFSYNQNDLKEQFNAFLKEIRESKLYDQIYDRWINNGDDAVMPQIEMPTSGKPIRAAVDGMSNPFTFIRNGEHAGFDIEILLRFAQSINRPIELSTISFGGLISALASGKVDMIASSLAPTPERAKHVNFSDPYFLHQSVMLVLSENMAGHIEETSSIKKKHGFFASISNSFYNNLIVEQRYILILKGLWKTLIIAVFAALLGTVLGGLVCFMRMSKKKIPSSFARGYIILMRGIPVLVLLMLLYYAVLAKLDINSSLVAIITFAMNFAAYVSEMFRTSINRVDPGQSEAGVAMGFTKVQTFVFIVMPQAVKSVLPVYKGELISLVKMTSVVGYIAVEDLTKASDIIRSRTFDAFFPLIMVAIIYFVLSWGLTALLDRMNKKIISR